MNWKQCKNGHLAKTKLSGCSMHIAVLFRYFPLLFSTVSQRLIYWQILFQKGQDKRSFKFASGDPSSGNQFLDKVFSLNYTEIKGTLALLGFVFILKILKLNNCRKGEYYFLLILILDVSAKSMKEWQVYI